MPEILAAYALEGIKAVPVKVLLDGDRPSVIESETDRCLPLSGNQHLAVQALEYVRFAMSPRPISRGT